MKKLITVAVLGAASVTLAACGGKLGEAEMMSASGSAFSKALYNDYIALSKGEYGEGDYTDSDRFAEKAMMAASGKEVGPYNPGEWQIPSNREAVMRGAYDRLTAALNGTAKDKATVQLARAQTSFDCWVQEQEENFQPDHIAACRDAFIAAMADVDKMTMVAKPAPAPAPAPKAMVAKPKTWSILFHFDSVKMLPGTNAKIKEAIAYVGNFKRPRVTIAGYTDTSGSKKYNAALSERRSEELALTAMDMGLDPKNVVMRSYGEDKLAEQTADGVKNQANRRATITVESK
ncbi:OmpA family protein [Sneathiella sp. P13V-1]|uniref:OmpA family protein n=1 Tax=Sneathiella sp. P13V-1 TaxID=2697366 RepID=UPI00187BAF32|nr:OmpA family protein [Sneathiella sp. P13V-1]MBE7636492.1 OmpA family protein [Sneathiella sp. P13V-1]